MAEPSKDFFAPYISKAIVNQSEMSVLRDAGASIDIVSQSHIQPRDLTGETVRIKQPLGQILRVYP